MSINLHMIAAGISNSFTVDKFAQYRKANIYSFSIYLILSSAVDVVKKAIPLDKKFNATIKNLTVMQSLAKKNSHISDELINSVRTDLVQISRLFDKEFGVIPTRSLLNEKTEYKTPFTPQQSSKNLPKLRSPSKYSQRDVSKSYEFSGNSQHQGIQSVSFTQGASSLEKLRTVPSQVETPSQSISIAKEDISSVKDADSHTHSFLLQTDVNTITFESFQDPAKPYPTAQELNVSDIFSISDESSEQDEEDETLSGITELSAITKESDTLTISDTSSISNARKTDSTQPNATKGELEILSISDDSSEPEDDDEILSGITELSAITKESDTLTISDTSSISKARKADSTQLTATKEELDILSISEASSVEATTVPTYLRLLQKQAISEEKQAKENAFKEIQKLIGEIKDIESFEKNFNHVQKIILTHLPQAIEEMRKIEEWCTGLNSMKSFYKLEKSILAIIQKKLEKVKTLQNMILLSKELNRMPPNVDPATSVNNFKDEWKAWDGEKPHGLYSIHFDLDNNLVLSSVDSEGNFNYIQFYFSEEMTVVTVKDNKEIDSMQEFEDFKQAIQIDTFKRIEM